MGLISIILGATSFAYSIFTGIPAVVIGIIALRRNTSNHLQAKIGIALGVAGSFFIIALILVLAHFFPTSITEQFKVSDTDRQRISTIARALEDYKTEQGAYPVCPSLQEDISECEEWNSFRSKNSDLPVDDIEVASDFFGAANERPLGTLVYSPGSRCLANRPVHAGLTEDEDSSDFQLYDHAALVFFYDGGRACFTVNVVADSG